MELAIISDTHMPKGARRLPEACLERLGAADLILHAGDLAALPVLREIELCGAVSAVRGNVDDAEVRAALPESRVVEAAGARIGMVHDAGPARGRLARLRRRFPDCDAVIFGHSHRPLHEEEGTFQIFNPGSPTERRSASEHTMGLARIDGAKVSFSLLPL